MKEVLLKTWSTFPTQSECSLAYKITGVMSQPRSMKMQGKSSVHHQRKKQRRRKRQSNVMLPTQVVLGGSPTQFGGCCKSPPVFSAWMGGFF